MITILVTGANGQLGQCLRELSPKVPESKFIFVSSKELDVTKKEDVTSFFSKTNFDYCVNCAAYTAVDKAESDEDSAQKVNVLGPKYLAEACLESNTKLIHISTDFVFDGASNTPYSEEDETKPLSVYGKTKLEGEIVISSILKECFILRTSWLYSEYGANFMKTMLRLSKKQSELGIIYDQIGSPTYAKDLAKVVIHIIITNSNEFGLYHYSNEGVASWYDFSKAIFEITNTKIVTNAIPTSAYPTPAKRPSFSVMDKTKLKNNFGIEIPYWRDSLKVAISNIRN